MKWGIVAGALLLVFPTGWWLRGRRRIHGPIWTLVGILPLNPLFNASISPIYENYRADVRGIEVTLLDLILWTMYIALPRSPQPSPYRVTRYAYLAVVLMSVLWAPSFLYASFAVWQLMRMYAALGVLSRAFRDQQATRGVLRGAMYGLIIEFLTVVYQRYALKLYQVPGGFDHQNSMAMTVNILLPGLLALVLAGGAGWLPLIALMGGAVAVLFSVSRGALAMLLAGMVIVILLSFARRGNARKFLLVLMTVAVLGAMFGKASNSIRNRFTSRGEAAGTRLRSQMIDAAALALHDYPFGIGINQYSLVMDTRGYAERVTKERNLPPVHQIYWLTAVELGWHGLVAFLALLIAPLSLALRVGWRVRRDRRGDLLLGLGTGLFLMYVHGLLESVWRQTSPAYVFWMTAALIAAIARDLRERPRGAAIPVRPASTASDRAASPTLDRHPLRQEGGSAAHLAISCITR